MKILGENTESYQKEAKKAAEKFKAEYYDLGAQTAEVKAVTITDRNNKLNFEVLGRVNGYETASNY